MDEQCIFCAIGKKQIPSYVLYEDEATLVFLDKHPATPGHAIVIPKNHVQTIFDMPIEYYTHVMGIAKKMGEYLVQSLGAEGVNILCSVGQAAGQRIPHAFVHVIPRYKEDGVHLAWDMKPAEDKDLESIQSNVLSLISGNVEVKKPVEEEKPKEKIEEPKKEPEVEKKPVEKSKPRIPTYW